MPWVGHYRSVGNKGFRQASAAQNEGLEETRDETALPVTLPGSCPVQVDKASPIFDNFVFVTRLEEHEQKDSRTSERCPSGHGRQSGGSPGAPTFLQGIIKPFLHPRRRHSSVRKYIFFRHPAGVRILLHKHPTKWFFPRRLLLRVWVGPHRSCSRLFSPAHLRHCQRGGNRGFSS